MGKSIRSKQKENGAESRDKIYKPLRKSVYGVVVDAEYLVFRTEAQAPLESWTTGNDDDAGAGNNAAANPDGLKVLDKFSDRMDKATEKKEKAKTDHFSFLDKVEIPEWQTTNPAVEAKRLASKLNKKKKKMATSMQNRRGRTR